MKQNHQTSRRREKPRLPMAMLCFISVVLLTAIFAAPSLFAANVSVASPTANGQPDWVIGLMVLFGPLLSTLFTLTVFDAK